MLFPVVLVLSVYLNSRLATKRGLNPFLWGLISLFAFFVGFVLLGSFYAVIFYKGPLNNEAVQAWIKNSPLITAMMTMLGVGGTLIVRYILERKPPAKQD
jgi:uncharacterized membrane protein YadS